jgi:hypothetical protein
MSSSLTEKTCMGRMMRACSDRQSVPESADEANASKYNSGLDMSNRRFFMMLLWA